MRKTAAVAVAKLHDINSSLVEEQGFLESLKVLHSFGVIEENLFLIPHFASFLYVKKSIMIWRQKI